MRKKLLLAFLVVLPLVPAEAARSDTTAASVVISEVYGGGGNTDATYTNDFVELHNQTRSSIDLTGAKIEYSPATSTSWAATSLSGAIPAYRYYLVRLASGGKTGVALPAPDATGSSNMARTGGKVRLVKAGAVLDLVGWGSSATAYEGARAPSSPDNVQSVSRWYGGCQDTNRNDKDFKLAKASPRNRTADGYYCGKNPVLNPIGNKAVVVGSTLSFTVSATDPDREALTYSASGVPSGASFSASTRTFSWRPRSSNIGDHRVTFSVSDGYRRDSETITISVKADTSGGRSTTTLEVVHQTRRLVAIGNVSPNHAGRYVTVRVFRYQQGGYRRVSWVQARLNSESNYYASIPRPRPGSCLVHVTFPGDADTTRSSAEEVVSC